eukprot:1157334-Pelagomonas_calceolata.AAC.17
MALYIHMIRVLSDIAMHRRQLSRYQDLPPLKVEDPNLATSSDGGIGSEIPGHTQVRIPKPVTHAQNKKSKGCLLKLVGLLHMLRGSECSKNMAGQLTDQEASWESYTSFWKCRVSRPQSHMSDVYQSFPIVAASLVKLLLLCTEVVSFIWCPSCYAAAAVGRSGSWCHRGTDLSA